MITPYLCRIPSLFETRALYDQVKVDCEVSTLTQNMRGYKFYKRMRRNVEKRVKVRINTPSPSTDPCD